MGNGDIVFFGTTDICIPFLYKLRENYFIKLIITQPDSVGGRSRKKIVPAVKTFALNNNIELLQPDKLKDISFIKKIKEINPIIGVVISYGKLIPEIIFKVPEYNTINVHFSLLPLYRGASPVQRSIENGENRTGITIFEIDKKMDTGEIWTQKEFNILENDTTETLLKRLSDQGSQFLVDSIRNIIGNKISKYPQNNDNATYTKPIKKEEGKVNWNLTAHQIQNKFRAFIPYPGLYFYINDRSFKIKYLKVSALSHNKNPGEILSLDKHTLKVCCGQRSVVEIMEFQPESKKPMTPYNFSLGNKLPEFLG